MAKNDPTPKPQEAPSLRCEIERLAALGALDRLIRALELLALASAAGVKHSDALDRAVREISDEILTDRAKASP